MKWIVSIYCDECEHRKIGDTDTADDAEVWVSPCHGAEHQNDRIILGTFEE